MYSLNLKPCLPNLGILKIPKLKYKRVNDCPILSKYNFKESKIYFIDFDFDSTLFLDTILKILD